MRILSYRRFLLESFKHSHDCGAGDLDNSKNIQVFQEKSKRHLQNSAMKRQGVAGDEASRQKVVGMRRGREKETGGPAS
jgi:hypothetical protein